MRWNGVTAFRGCFLPFPLVLSFGVAVPLVLVKGVSAPFFLTALLTAFSVAAGAGEYEVAACASVFNAVATECPLSSVLRFFVTTTSEESTFAGAAGFASATCFPAGSSSESSSSDSALESDSELEDSGRNDYSVTVNNGH